MSNVFYTKGRSLPEIGMVIFIVDEDLDWYLFKIIKKKEKDFTSNLASYMALYLAVENVPEKSIIFTDCLNCYKVIMNNWNPFDLEAREIVPKIRELKEKKGLEVKWVSAEMNLARLIML